MARFVSGRGGMWDAGLVAVDARVEHVGSLLRPRFLRDARESYARGELTPAGLKAAEDRAGKRTRDGALRTYSATWSCQCLAGPIRGKAAR